VLCAARVFINIWEAIRFIFFLFFLYFFNTFCRLCLCFLCAFCVALTARAINFNCAFACSTFFSCSFSSFMLFFWCLVCFLIHYAKGKSWKDWGGSCCLFCTFHLLFSFLYTLYFLLFCHALPNTFDGKFFNFFSLILWHAYFFFFFRVYFVFCFFLQRCQTTLRIWNASISVIWGHVCVLADLAQRAKSKL